MTEAKQKREEREEYFLGEIYKSSKMGADAIISLLPHIKEDGLRSVVTMQLDGYEKYAARAAAALEARGLAAKQENLVTRLSSRAGIAINTLLDSTLSHIAELLIEGSNMTITEMTRLLNDHEARGKSKDAVRLANEVVRFEEHNLEMLRRYL